MNRRPKKITAASSRRIIARTGTTLQPVRGLSIIRTRPVALEVPADASAAPNPRWIQIASEGTYLGHPQGPFELDADVFDELTKNFRAHPSYVAGADGYGAADVIPFDWRHVSEQKPVDIVSEAAQSWARDLEARKGADGKAQLWALTNLLEPAKSLIEAKKIKWTSVAVWPDAKDPVTAADIGWYLSSIAFTNDPFIQGMQPIAASLGWDPWNPPDDPDDVVSCLRKIFGLPEVSALGDVMKALADLRAFATGTLPSPPGVDVDCLIANVRQLFNLRTLATTDEVFAEADQLLAALAASQAAPSGGMGNSTPGAYAAERDQNMTILAILAASLRCAATDEAVRGAVLTLQTEASDAKTKIMSLLGAIGEQDPEAAYKKVADMIQSAAKLKAVMPELAELENMKDQTEEAAANEDVGKAMAAYRMPAEAGPALFALRYPGRPSPEERQDPKFRERRAAKLADAKARFAASYPIAPEQLAYLSQDILGAGGRAPAPPSMPAPGGYTLSAYASSSGPSYSPSAYVPQGAAPAPYGSPFLASLEQGPTGPRFAPRAPAPPPGQGNGAVTALANFPGRNQTEKAINLVRSLPGGDKLSWDEAHAKASEMIATGAAA